MRPEHYQKGGLEVFEIMRVKMDRERYIGFLEGNVLKYMFRYQHKNGIEDLKKARTYLELMIEETGKESKEDE